MRRCPGLGDDRYDDGLRRVTPTRHPSGCRSGDAIRLFVKSSASEMSLFIVWARSHHVPIAIIQITEWKIDPTIADCFRFADPAGFDTVSWITDRFVKISRVGEEAIGRLEIDRIIQALWRSHAVGRTSGGCLPTARSSSLEPVRVWPKTTTLRVIAGLDKADHRARVADRRAGTITYFRHGLET